MNEKEKSKGQDLERVQAEVIEAELVPLTGGAMADVDINITTAKKYPRNLETFKKRALSMATMDEETAAGCFYVLQKGGKRIEGPSVRLAEIVKVCYGNLRSRAWFVGETEDRKSIIAEGLCYDTENNVAESVQITRRIVDKYGKRYPQDVIETTKLAGIAIAGRNATYKIVPKVYVDSICDACRAVALGKAAPFEEMRQKWFEHAMKICPDKDRVLAALGKPSVDNLDRKDIETLIGLCTAIKDGDATVEDQFPSLTPEQPPATLAEKVKAGKEAIKPKQAGEATQIDISMAGNKPREAGEEG